MKTNKRKIPPALLALATYRATLFGSTATTPSGLVRFALRILRERAGLRAENELLARRGWRRIEYYDGPLYARGRTATRPLSAWLAVVAERKADPEAKRARTDKAFRRRWSARLAKGWRRLDANGPTPHKSELRNGRWRTVQSAIGRYSVRSVAVIDPQDDRNVLHLLHKTANVVRLPEGWRWRLDRLGLAAVGPDETDYHPTAGVLLGGAGAVVACAQVEAATRRGVVVDEQLRAALEAGNADPLVCAADSLRAGNCRAGTLAWAGLAALPIDRHVPASVLRRLGQTAGEESRVRLACIAALKREEKEKEKGYCLVTDHRLPS